MSGSAVDYIAIGVSIFALGVSGYSAIQYRKANSIAQKALDKTDSTIDIQQSALKLQEAALETQITHSIGAASKEIREAVLALSNVSQTAPNYAIFEKNYRSAQETWLNAYDQACMSYREGKLNKETFKKIYLVPIRKLFEDKDFHHFFNPVDTSDYPSIIAVYREWVSSQR
ncbi:TPA: hypothetical protein OR518_003658 [Escherichia coli]|nr:hypothetical protein [Salmonella enterica]HCS7470079.1 hypothetical protein [Escherichia coli]